MDFVIDVRRGNLGLRNVTTDLKKLDSLQIVEWHSNSTTCHVVAFIRLGKDGDASIDSVGSRIFSDNFHIKSFTNLVRLAFYICGSESDVLFKGR